MFGVNQNQYDQYSEKQDITDAVSETMTIINELDKEQLNKMLQDEEHFENFVKDIRQLKQWETSKELLIASNRSLAEYNLTKEPELQTLKQSVLEKSETAEQLCQSLQGKLSNMKSQGSNVTLDTVLALLETKAAESEEASDSIADNFLKGKIDADEFLEEFSKERKVMHLRKVKVDKMGELIRKKEQSVKTNLFPGPNGQPAPYANFYSAPYPSSSNQAGYPPIPGSMIYPVMPNMPMPMPGLPRNPF